MGWLWSSNTTHEQASHSLSGEDASINSTPAPSDHRVLQNTTAVDPPSTHTDDHDVELQSLLASLETPSKPNGTSSTSSKAPMLSDPKTITPSSIYPTEMSCRSAFDSAYYCQSLGGQFNNIYRYGTFRDCSDQWKQFWFCMRTNRGFLGDKERGSRIQDHYKLREMKYRVGTSSEDVWKPRTRMVESAFDGDLEADERAEKERMQAETS
ncbi:MAG: hypothetical protein LQ343_005780 [Gyalolechia ehrenbergii]|nr:MAG: hypothetical protein LQ343_005780 [Gyalolechia ehrenbergii]